MKRFQPCPWRSGPADPVQSAPSDCPGKHVYGVRSRFVACSLVPWSADCRFSAGRQREGRARTAPRGVQNAGHRSSGIPCSGCLGRDAAHPRNPTPGNANPVRFRPVPDRSNSVAFEMEFPLAARPDTQRPADAGGNHDLSFVRYGGGCHAISQSLTMQDTNVARTSGAGVALYEGWPVPGSVAIVERKRHAPDREAGVGCAAGPTPWALVLAKAPNARQRSLLCLLRRHNLPAG